MANRATKSRTTTASTSNKKRKHAAENETVRKQGKIDQFNKASDLYHQEDVTTIPPFPSGIDSDELLCRRILLPARDGLTFDVFAKEVLKQGYEDQYSPSEVTFYNKNHNKVSNTVQLRRALKQQEWCDGLINTNGSKKRLVIVSAMNSEENELLVIPATLSATTEVIRKALQPPPTAVARVLPEVERDVLALSTASLWAPLPIPAHVDDWHAQYLEEPQGVREFSKDWRSKMNWAKRRFKTVVSIQPIERRGSDAPALPNLKNMRTFIAAYFDLPEDQVEILPTAEIEFTEKNSKKRRRYAKYLPTGGTIEYRDKAAVGSTVFPNGQLAADHLIREVLVNKTRFQVGGSSFCVLGATMEDLFSGRDSIFTAGLAFGGDQVASFSFGRYVPTGVPKSVAEQITFARACKTAVHEIAHMFGVDHCTFRRCCMNGSGNLREDFEIPHALCPVDLMKWAFMFGPSQFDIRRRFERLKKFCDGRRQFASYHKYLSKALKILDSNENSV